MITLAIETSCDETAAAVTDGEKVLSSVVWSQIKYHREWGGVVPSVARRAHEERLPLVVETAIRRAKTHWHETCATCGTCDTCIEAIVVTIGPGLAPALEAGIEFAKKLALEKKLPLIPVNHLEGHIASIFLRNRSGNYYVQRSPVGATPRPARQSLTLQASAGGRVDRLPRTEPRSGTGASLFLKRKSNSPYLSNSANLTNLPSWISLIVSGGHTELVETTKILNTEYRIQNKKLNSSHSEFSIPRPVSAEGGQNSEFHHLLLGQTLDDAAGECIDKVGRELGLGYPAGPVLERFAIEGNPRKFKFPVPMERSPRTNLNFSFSGLKTAAVQMIYQTHDIKKASQRDIKEISKQQICDFCASFQEAVIEAILLKLKRAIEITGIKTVFLSGGVAANNQLRRQAGTLVRSLGGQFYATPKQFSTDNAAMIGLAAQWAYSRGEVAKTRKEILAVDRQPNLNFLAA